MARRNTNCPPSETARVRLEGIARGPLADRLRASLHRRHPRCSADEIAEAYQEAYLRALRACPVEDEAAIYAWLRRTMDNLLVDRMRLLSHEAPVSDTAGVFVRASDTSANPEQELERTEERRELVALFELVSQGLAPRQRAVLGRYVRGVRRRQIARELGVSERVVKRDLESILARARALLIKRSGGGCGEGNGAVLRYAFGLASGSEAARAHAHLASCPSCQSFLERLGSWRDAAAAAVPVPAAGQADLGRVERAVHGFADIAAGVKQHIAGPAASLRQQGSDGAVHLKQQATASYYRAVDPTPLSGLRPARRSRRSAPASPSAGAPRLTALRTTSTPSRGWPASCSPNPSQSVSLSRDPRRSPSDSSRPIRRRFPRWHSNHSRRPNRPRPRPPRKNPRRNSPSFNSLRCSPPSRRHRRPHRPSRRRRQFSSASPPPRPLAPARVRPSLPHRRDSQPPFRRRAARICTAHEKPTLHTRPDLEASTETHLLSRPAHLRCRPSDLRQRARWAIPAGIRPLLVCRGARGRLPGLGAERGAGRQDGHRPRLPPRPRGRRHHHPSAAQSGYAPARARAYAVMAVPPGMEIRRLVWAGEMWRRDCDWTAELYAVYANGARQNIYTKPCRNRTDKVWLASRFKRQTIPFSPGNPYFGGHYPTQIIQRVRCIARRCETSVLRTPSGRRVTRVDAG